MAKLWTQEENEIFVDIMPAYRKPWKKAQHIKQITTQYVTELLSHALLINRSRQAVYEHLTYYDDLLEGIGTIGNYGSKDSVYFGKPEAERA